MRCSHKVSLWTSKVFGLSRCCLACPILNLVVTMQGRFSTDDSNMKTIFMYASQLNRVAQRVCKKLLEVFTVTRVLICFFRDPWALIIGAGLEELAYL